MHQLEVNKFLFLKRAAASINSFKRILLLIMLLSACLNFALLIRMGIDKKFIRLRHPKFHPPTQLGDWLNVASYV